jgi:hypothetical protein
MQQSARVVVGEHREIEESRDVVDVEQMHLVGPARETHGDDWHTREERIAFPRFERDGCQDIVLTEHDVGAMCLRSVDCIGHTNDAHCVDTQLSEKLPDVIAQIAMSTDTQGLQCARSPDTGDIRSTH